MCGNVKSGGLLETQRPKNLHEMACSSVIANKGEVDSRLRGNDGGGVLGITKDGVGDDEGGASGMTCGIRAPTINRL
jgi:hypothetical protein